MQKCELELRTPPLIIIYTFFIKSHIYYVNVFFDQLFDNSLDQRLEPTQYNAIIARRRATRKPSNEKLYQASNLVSRA